MRKMLAVVCLTLASVVALAAPVLGQDGRADLAQPVVLDLGPLPDAPQPLDPDGPARLDDASLTALMTRRQADLLVLDERMDGLVRMVASDDGPDALWQPVFDEAAWLREAALSDPAALTEYRALVTSMEQHLLPQAVAEVPMEDASTGEVME